MEVSVVVSALEVERVEVLPEGMRLMQW